MSDIIQNISEIIFRALFGSAKKLPDKNVRSIKIRSFTPPIISCTEKAQIITNTFHNIQYIKPAQKTISIGSAGHTL